MNTLLESQICLPCTQDFSPLVKHWPFKGAKGSNISFWRVCDLTDFCAPMHESPERSNNAVDDDEGALSNQQVPWVATSHGHGSLDLHATLGYNNPISQPPDTGDVQPNPEEEEELEVNIHL